MSKRQIIKDVLGSFTMNTDYSILNDTLRHDRFFLSLNFLTKEFFEPFNENGVPQKVYNDRLPKILPTRACAYGFWLLENNKIREFLNLTAELENLYPQSKAMHDFTWLDLEPGWVSCMAQGHLSQIFALAYTVNGNKIYLEKGLKAIDHVIAQDKTTDLTLQLASGHVIYQEYPSCKRSGVLNGYLYFLISVYKLANVAKDEKLRDLYITKVRELNEIIDEWNFQGWSIYDLTHLNNPSQSINLSSISYHKLVISQLRFICITSDTSELINLEKVINDWVHSSKKMSKRLLNLSRKIIHRIENPIQR